MGKQFQSVYRNSAGNWRARWVVDGKRVSRTFATKKDALAHLSILRADKLRGPLAGPEARKPLRDWCNQWLRNVSPYIGRQTVHAYTTTVRAIEKSAIGLIPLDTLTPSDVQRWVSEYSKTHSPNTVANALGVLKTALRDARTKRVIRDLPTDGVRAPKRQNVRVQDKVPTVAEVRALFEALDHVHGTALLVMALTGARWSEAYGLRPSDVEGDLITFRRTMEGTGRTHDGLKAGDERTVPIPEALVVGIAVIKQYDEFLFPVDSYRQWLKKIWNPACIKAGVTTRPHDLRRFAASTLDLAGVSQRGRMDLLGHSSALVSAKYLKQSTAAQIQARDALERALLG